MTKKPTTTKKTAAKTAVKTAPRKATPKAQPAPVAAKHKTASAVAKPAIQTKTKVASKAVVGPIAIADPTPAKLSPAAPLPELSPQLAKPQATSQTTLQIMESKSPPQHNAAKPASTPEDISFTPALCIVGEDQPVLFSLTPRERLIRQFERAGLTQVLTQDQAELHKGPIILVRADAVIDTPLIPTLIKRPSFLLLGDDEETPIAATVRGNDVAAAARILNGEAPRASLPLLARAPGQLDTDFWKSLRKRETPYALVLNAQNQANIEWRVFMGTYKGATDLVTKHLWPVPAFYVTRFLAPRGITPNMVTTVGLIMTILTYWLFYKGYFGWGLVTAWLMTFLDTVDGKLARTTLTSSPWGNIFDHGIDLIHPPFWYVAWALGLAHVGYVWSPEFFWGVILAILAGYVLQRILEGIALRLLGSNIHIWRPIDTLFRQITARRNPNLVILTLFTLIMRPDWGLVAVAIWTIVCLLLHVIQIFQAYAAWKKEGKLVSWMTKP